MKSEPEGLLLQNFGLKSVQFANVCSKIIYPNKPRFGVRYQAFFRASSICEFGVYPF